VVHVGEFGVYQKVPHPVALAWLKDALRLFSDQGWGWCLWQLRGEFGILDSGRADARLVDTGHGKLDVAMLDVLRNGRGR
jgi:endoglucanase